MAGDGGGLRSWAGGACHAWVCCALGGPEDEIPLGWLGALCSGWGACEWAVIEGGMGSALASSLPERGSMGGRGMDESKKKIHVVEDEANILNLVELLVRSIGHEPYCFSSGEAALAAARASCPDLLLTDYRMAGMNGVELIEAVRATVSKTIRLFSSRAINSRRVSSACSYAI